MALLLCRTSYASDGADVRDLLRQGVQLRREHRDEEALDVFRRALSISETPTVLAQVALAEQALGRWVDAERDLRTALRADGDDWIARNRAILAESQEQVAHHLGWLTVSVDVPHAEAAMGDHPFPVNLETRVAAGPASVTIAAAGYAQEKRSIDVAPGAHERVEVKLAALEPPESVSPPRPPSPLLSLPASTGGPARGAHVPAGPLVLGVAGLAAVGAGTYFGVHTLDDKHQRDALCSASSCDPSAFGLDADARSSSLVSTLALGAGVGALAGATLWWALDTGPGGSSRERIVGPVVLGALGVAALGTGAYLGLLAFDDKRSRDAQCTSGGCAPPALSYDSEARTAADSSTASFVAGGALLAGAAVLWAVHREPETQGGEGLPSLAVAVGPTGVLVHGTLE